VGEIVSAAVWNLIGASLCTVGTAVGAYGLYLMYQTDPSDINRLFVIGGLVATVGGLAWVVSAIMLVSDDE
jgi:hypothetical protein